MPPKNRGHGGGSRPHGGRPASIRGGQDSAAEVAATGRVRDGIAGGRSPMTDAPVTHGTGRPGGTPDGPQTRINRDDDATTRASINRENSAAALLADQGYRIMQNPSHDEIAQARQSTGDTGRPTSRPDYLLEGRVFDCYSPKETTSTRNIWTAVQEKVMDNQTQRVVVNLQDWRGDMAAFHRQFADWPVENLKEVKAITPDGDVIQILPTSHSE